MVESKSVKVDNWGVFFLQKLQNFFNKTDYCDLTLQFMDNSQLKVHRLVLSACTDYFNVLEQQCDFTDDVLTMPYDLQADVVVPIVNFMYTGTLEFEVTMYGRLLKTAKDMNMTVLLKLLEAHKRTVNVNAQPARVAPVLLNKGAAHRPTPTVGGAHQRQQQQTMQHRQMPASPARQRIEAAQKNVGRPTVYNRRAVPDPVRLVSKYGGNAASSSQVKGPSRFDCNEEQASTDQFETSFDNISYESRPLATAGQSIKEERRSGDASGSFEQLRKGYTGVKRPASSLGSDSPPQKKPNIQDVKEYTEAHKMRKKFVAEENDDDDDNDPDYVDEAALQLATETTLIGGKGGDNVDHAKIISEVLKKYPHLVKNNKNIKLKITQKGHQQTITAPLRGAPSSSSTPKATGAQKLPIRGAAAATVDKRSAAATSSSKDAADRGGRSPETKQTVVNQAVNSSNPKKIDSRTMHALIAKGAENTTGPWLCLKCGVNGRPISIPSYKGFRRHLINVHKLKIDPKLCEHCGWKSARKEELHHHVLVVHNINPPPDMKFPKCSECNFVAIDAAHMKTHTAEKHAKSSKAPAMVQHCLYCYDGFPDEPTLYDHMRTSHRDRAREDGIMDTDDEDLEDDDEEYVPSVPVKKSAAAAPAKDSPKIQIISNITLPNKGVSYDPNAPAISSITGSSPRTVQLEPSSEAEGLSHVATGIATSLGVLDPDHLEEEGASSQDESNISAYLEDEMASVHGEVVKAKDADDAPVEEADVETRFVTEEGSTIDLTEKQKTELLKQLQDQQGVVMILNDDAFAENAEGSKNASEETKVSSPDDKQIVEDVGKSNSTSAVQDESIKDENTVDEDTNKVDALPEEHPDEVDAADTSASETPVAATVPSAKKLIEGDWSDDENDDEEEEEELAAAAKPETPVPQLDKSEPDASSPELTSIPPTRSYRGRDGRTSNDSVKEATVVSQDSGIVEQASGKDTVVGDADDSTLAPSQLVKSEEDEEEEEEEDQLDIDVPQTDQEELKKASKIEIKTLINDWGDDDDDEHLD